MDGQGDEDASRAESEKKGNLCNLCCAINIDKYEHIFIFGNTLLLFLE